MWRKNDKYEVCLDSDAAPLPAHVVEENTRQTGAEEAADGEGRRPQGGDEGVGLDVVLEVGQLPGSVEGAGVRCHKDSACAGTKDHQAH